MAVIVDNPEYQIIETDTPTGVQLNLVYKAGTGGLNQLTIFTQAKTAVTNNLNYINNIAPTATAAQVAAQVLALTRQVDGLIRYLLGQFDATN